MGMPAPTTSIDFLDTVRKSGLVPEQRIALYLRQNSSVEPATVERVADDFVRAGLITFFQAKQLKEGRYKRFEIAGKYRLLELLGVGGMGAVYLCEHKYLKRLVAVKVLPLDKIAADSSALERFYREARAVAALDHPNVVRAHDIDRFENFHFLVMEYVDGASLQELISRHTMRKTIFDPIRAAHYIAQGAAGIQHAYELGLIHRDIKPGNLLLDRSGTIKVLDMGLARFFDDRHDNLTQRFDDGSVLGTADYLAPEQASNDPVDVRADIYGLGGTLYFLLTGKSPFPEGNVAEKLVAQQLHEPKPVSSFRTDVPAGLLEVLFKMMRKRPAERYQTPAELITALEPWTQVPIAPPTATEMPVLSPAVLDLIHLNPRFAERVTGAGASLPVPRTSGSSIRVGMNGSQALVPTRRGQDTAPIRRTAPVTLTPADQARAPQQLQKTGYSRARLVAIGAGSFLLAALILIAGFLIFLR
jgi:eukaryotic-like serine/threonine-protein kinase